MFIFLIIFSLGLCITLFMYVRNEWVFKKRTNFCDAAMHELNKGNIEKCDELQSIYRYMPSYGEMMRRFWVWDFSVFLNEGKQNFHSHNLRLIK